MLPPAITTALADFKIDVTQAAIAVLLVIVVIVMGGLIKRVFTPLGASLAGWREFAKWKNDSSR